MKRFDVVIFIFFCLILIAGFTKSDENTVKSTEISPEIETKQPSFTLEKERKQSSDTVEEDTKSLIADARNFEASNEYDIAFQKILRCIKVTEEKLCLQELNDFLIRRGTSLPQLEHTEITTFTPQKVSMKEYFDTAKAAVLGYGAGTAIISSYGAYLAGITGAGAAAAGTGLAALPILATAPIVYVWLRDDIQISSEERNKIILEEISKHEKILQDLEKLKEYTITAQDVVHEYLVSNNFDKDITVIKKNIEIFKDYLKKYRSTYLSYSVVSPNLALCSQLIFIAKKKTLNPFGADEDTLRVAAETMATATSSTILKGTNQDVRKQFLSVYTEFKSVAGKALLEELKTIQTLTDNVLNHSLGDSAWWE